MHTPYHTTLTYISLRKTILILVVDPPFCPLNTCPIRYLFGTLQQLPSGPLLLMQPIFSKPPWELWLRDLSNPIVTLSNPNLDLGSLKHPKPIQIHLAHWVPLQAYLGTLDPFRYTWPIGHHFRPTQTPQTHLDTLGPLDTTFDPLGATLGPFRHLRPIQTHLTHQTPPYAHLGTLGPIRCTWPTQDHSSPPKPILAHLGPLRFTQSCLGHILGTSCMVA